MCSLQDLLLSLPVSCSLALTLSSCGINKVPEALWSIDFTLVWKPLPYLVTQITVWKFVFVNFEYGKLEFIAKFPKLGSDLKCNVYYFIWILCIHTEQQDGFYDQVTYQVFWLVGRSGLCFSFPKRPTVWLMFDATTVGIMESWRPLQRLSPVQ